MDSSTIETVFCCLLGSPMACISVPAASLVMLRYVLSATRKVGRINRALNKFICDECGTVCRRLLEDLYW